MPLQKIAYSMGRRFLPALPYTVYMYTRNNGVEAS